AALALAVTPTVAAQTGSIPGDSAGLQGSAESLGSAEGSLGSLLPGESPTENEGLYTGEVEVVGGEADDPTVLTGQVFDDTNRNSVLDADEVGIPDVQVSNGLDVVTTDSEGRYELPVRDN